jgi:hypothetical protein
MSQKTESKRRKRRQRNRWIPVLLGLSGLALLVVAALSLRGGGRQTAEIEVSGAPALRVDKEVIDFGDVKINQPVEATFTITNAGDQPLQFEEQPYIELVEGC